MSHNPQSIPRIAHITTIDGSLKHLLLNQMLSIEQAGYDICGISTPGTDVPVIEEAGIRHVAVPMSRRLSPIADLMSLWRLTRVMRREQFTLVHTHNPKPGLLGQLAARIAGVPIVVNTIHGYHFHERLNPLARRFYIILERLASLCSDTILFQNHEDMETAVGEKICTPGKTRYLGNGIDLSRFNPDRFTRESVRTYRNTLGIPGEAYIVGFVGRLSARRKGFLHFLAAAKELVARDLDVYFLIVGAAYKGESDAVQPEAARQFGIEDRCLFLGRLPNEVLPGLFKLMDVLVLPSLFEGVPRAVMEASAMGVPVVVSDVKGNRDAVVQGRNGLLVPFGDVSAIARAVEDILTDRKMAQEMQLAGRRIAAERFDEQSVFDIVKTEYARLLLRKGYSLPVAKRVPRATE